MDPATQKVTYPQEALAGLGTACVQVAITQPYEVRPAPLACGMLWFEHFAISWYAIICCGMCC